jgi:alpha-N-arabinofuranosidase
MKWCEALGTEPYLCFNFGTGTLDEGMILLADGLNVQC